MANETPNDEKALLAEIARGDKQAFTIIFNRYQRDLYLFSKSLTKSKDVAIEIVQEVFIKIWTNREQLDHVENFGGYLNRIVRNHSLNTIKKIARKARVQSGNPIEQEDFGNVVADEGTLQQLDYNDAMRVLNAALQELAPQQKQVYQLCHVEGMKYEEVAQMLGISIETVRVHMKRALKKIRLHFHNNSYMYAMLIIAMST